MKTMTGAIVFVGALVASCGAFADVFTVTLGDDAGTQTELSGVQSVEMGAISFPPEEVGEITPDLPPGLAAARKEGRVIYRPGASSGTLNFRLVRQYGGTKEFQDWYDASRAGAPKHRSVTVSSMNDQHVVQRVFIYSGAVLDSYEVVSEPGCAACAATERVSGHAEGFQMLPGGGGKPSNGATGVPVTVTDYDGTAQTDMWDSWSGGEPMLLLEPLVANGVARTPTQGSSQIREVVLTGYVTPSRPALCQWINDALAGKLWRYSVQIPFVPGGVAKGVNYFHTWPSTYHPPTLNATDGGAHAKESLELMVETMTLKTK